MEITGRMKFSATRLLTSAIVSFVAIVVIGFGAATPTQANPPVLTQFSSLYQALDSITTFSYDLNQTIDLMMSYIDSVAAYDSSIVADSNPVSGDINEFPLVTFSKELFSTPTPFQSVSMLSPALYDGINLAPTLSLFGEAAERIERGMLIRALPLSLPVEGTTLTSGFGMRNHPILRGRRMHQGLDMAAPSGTSIYAPGGGTVIFSGTKRGYGNVVIIDHGYGYTTLYAHCSKRLVDVGAKVSRGDLIALVGSTGRSTGPHLHYEVRINDTHLNPESFLVYTRDQIGTLDAIADHYMTF